MHHRRDELLRLIEAAGFRILSADEIAGPILAQVAGRALVVTVDGCTAAATGLVVPDRVMLPDAMRPGTTWLPSLGQCTADPVPGGWLLRLRGRAAEPVADLASLVLDLTTVPARVRVTGPGGQWRHTLTRSATRRSCLRSWCTREGARPPSWRRTCSAPRPGPSRSGRRSPGCAAPSGAVTACRPGCSTAASRWLRTQDASGTAGSCTPAAAGGSLGTRRGTPLRVTPPDALRAHPRQFCGSVLLRRRRPLAAGWSRRISPPGRTPSRTALSAPAQPSSAPVSSAPSRATCSTRASRSDLLTDAASRQAEA